MWYVLLEILSAKIEFLTQLNVTKYGKTGIEYIEPGLSELFQVGGCDEKVGGCKSRRGKTLGASGGMPTGKFLNLESLKWHFLHFQKRFINQVF